MKMKIKLIEKPINKHISVFHEEDENGKRLGTHWLDTNREFFLKQMMLLRVRGTNYPLPVVVKSYVGEDAINQWNDALFANKAGKYLKAVAKERREEIEEKIKASNFRIFQQDFCQWFIDYCHSAPEPKIEEVDTEAFFIDEYNK